MLLTIGMIVKNEEKYLERCLNGIKPILEQVDSELIIADTGSTDRTVEIARQFTDNVFYFEWIKDFAAARNSTLEKAQGEWYMFVDADEIFESCDEIIHFFNSGEYKKYKSATFIVRNILTYDGEPPNCSYSDFRAPRMTKILPDSMFVSPIHEHLTPLLLPTKPIDDFAWHYGYCATPKSEESQAKFERNSELLLNKLKSGDVSGRLYLQLYECYGGIDNEKARQYLDEGIKFCEDSINAAVVSKIYDETLPVLYAKKTGDLYGLLNDNEAVLEICEKYFNMPKVLRPYTLTTDVDIYCAKGLALVKLERYEEAISNLTKFFELFRDYSNGKLLTYESYISTRVFARDDNFLAVLQRFVYACMKSDKYKLAADYMKKLPIGKYCLATDKIVESVRQAIELLSHFGYDEASKYYVRFNDVGKQIFKDMLYSAMWLEEEKSAIADVLINLDPGDSEFNKAVSLFRDCFNKKEISKHDLVEFISQNGNKFNEMLYVILDSKEDAIELSEAGLNLKEAVFCCYVTIKDFHSIIEQYTSDCIKSADSLEKYAVFCCYAMNAALTAKRRGIFVTRDISRLFENYAAIGKKYISETGASADELPENIIPTVIADNIIHYRKNKDYKNCIAEMRRIVEAYPEISVVINEYKKAVLKEYEGSQPATEMQRLAVMIKSNIRKYIASGNIEAAAKTLAEYEKINPNDPEIDEIKAEIK